MQFVDVTSVFPILIFSGSNLGSKRVEAGNKQQSVGNYFGRDVK